MLVIKPDTSAVTLQLCTAGEAQSLWFGFFFYLILVGTKNITNLIYIMSIK